MGASATYPAELNTPSIRPRRARRGVDGILDGGFVGDVARDRDRALELVRHLRRTLLHQVDDCDASTLGGVGAGDGRADPGPAPGRKQHLSVEACF